MTHQDILKLLPHRYPFLLVDGVTEIELGEYIRGYKNISFNEPQFHGHFPGNPIMPGVLILEAMAQLGIIFAKKTEPAIEEKLVVFAGIDGVRFRSPVLPGHRMDMELKLIKKKRNIWKMGAVASVDGKTAVEAVLLAAIQD